VTVQLRVPKPAEKGVVYTKAWVVDLILDFVGYRADQDLGSMVAVEPAAGEGAFLLQMVRRLVGSLKSHGRELQDATDALVAYEIDPESADMARQLIVEELLAHSYGRPDAVRAAKGWVKQGDYLLTSAKDPRADFVVGNPPYIRYDDIPPSRYAEYQSVCSTMVGRCDIYVGFIEAALHQLKDDGRLGFICADRWMRAAYGTEIRRLVAELGSVEVVIEMHDAQAFEDDVAAYPAVTVIRRGHQGPALVASANKMAGPVASGNLAESIVELSGKRRSPLSGFQAATLEKWHPGDAPWPWAEPASLKLLQELEARFGLLENPATGTKIGIGVASGADRVFITTDEHCVEKDRLLPLAIASDAHDGAVKWSGHYLVDPWGPDDQLIDLAKYPRTRAYFEAHSSALKRRNIAGRHQARWYRTIDRVTHSILGKEKLYFSDMKLQSTPFLDRGQTYPHHNLCYITSDVWDLEVLGGLLLSKIAELFVASYCLKMRGGTLRFQARYLRRIRVPSPETLSVGTMVSLRHAFRAYDRDKATAAAMDAYGIKQLPFAP
jgi:adenine-specific DNA-methyltransferase